MNGAIRIAFLDRATFAPHIAFPRPACPHEWHEWDRTAPDEVVERLRGMEVAVVNKVRIGEPQLSQLPGLRLIVVTATGTDNIDLDACRRRDVAVANVRGYATISVPEHVFALILSLRRALVSYRAGVIEGSWQRSRQFCLFGAPIRDLRGSTLGIVGLGAIGREVARLGMAFGMRVVATERGEAQDISATRLPLGVVLAQSDVISLHCPLTSETRHMLAEPQFAAMRRGALLINTARGALIDDAALVRALEGGILGGIGLDVLDTEPPAPDHPLLRWAKDPRVIVTPHVAWASDEAMQDLAAQVIASIERFVGSRGKTATYDDRR